MVSRSKHSYVAIFVILFLAIASLSNNLKVYGQATESISPKQLRDPFQRKVCDALNREWVSFNNGTSIVLTSKGKQDQFWREPICIGDLNCGFGERFCFAYDAVSTTFHYVWYYEKDRNLYYRRVTPQSNGDVDLNDSCIVFDGTEYGYCLMPYISIDGLGFPWVVACYSNSSNSIVRVFKSTTQDGSFVVENGFPHEFPLSQSALNTPRGITLKLGSKMCALYQRNNDYIYCNFYDNHQWSDTELVTQEKSIHGDFMSGVATIDGKIFLAYSACTENGYSVRCCIWNGTWTEELVLENAGVSQGASVSLLKPSTVVIFWEDNPALNHIYYKEYIDGWSPTRDWAISNNPLTDSRTLQSSYEDEDGEVFVAFQTNMSLNFGFEYKAFAETEYMDNISKYDVNKDQTVDVKDVFIVGKAFGSIPCSLNWNPLCDFNNDSSVDIKDYYIMSRVYGFTC